MTEPRPSVEEAAERGDVTVAFTPLQLVLIAVLGLFLLRLLRRWWAEARARELLDRA
jgi:hypothetical protein